HKTNLGRHAGARGALTQQPVATIRSARASGILARFAAEMGHSYSEMAKSGRPGRQSWRLESHHFPNILPAVIDTDLKLAGFLPAVRAAKWLALDTEAYSWHAYPEKVCLIQISTVEGDFLIDPLAKIDLDPLLHALA